MKSGSLLLLVVSQNKTNQQQRHQQRKHLLLPIIRTVIVITTTLLSLITYIRHIEGKINHCHPHARFDLHLRNSSSFTPFFCQLHSGIVIVIRTVSESIIFSTSRECSLSLSCRVVTDDDHDDDDDNE